MLRKIDSMMIKGFIGPFFVAFGIALFVLIMQFLWLYIDEIAGKGVGILIMAQLISYLSVAMFPMALPIAVLISSVMVIGDAAEHYELSSMKSAGTSLLRVMRPLILIGAGIAFFSYLCSDFLIPIANLGFKSRLTDIRRQKPALALEEGVFNADFSQFVIKIGKKFSDNETIKDVLIEENRNNDMSFSQVLSDSGRMFTSADQRFFVMKLYNGTQYQEPSRSQRNQNEKAPFIRTNFKEWTKVFDLGEFEMTRTDEDRFSTQRSMMSMAQLRDRLDTLNMEITDLKSIAVKNATLNVARALDEALQDSLLEKARKIPRPPNGQDSSLVPIQVLDKPLTAYTSFEETFGEKSRKGLKNSAQSTLRGYRNSFLSNRRQTEDREMELIKTSYELYVKYTFALICFVFMFIGCSMGALIRKGGFGYPILVCIVFFVLFIFLTIGCRQLAEARRLSPFWAAMLPCLVLAPVAAIMTYFAIHDNAPPTWQSLLRRLKKR